MKPQLSAMSSSVKSTTTTIEDDVRTEIRDSCYYPGCRKDANCSCEICLASINATLDLMPASIQKSSFTKLSSSMPNVLDQTPIAFDPSIMSTPRSSSCCLVESPALKSTARLNWREKEKKKKGKKGSFEGVFWNFLFGLILVFGMEIGFSWVFGGLIKPTLTRDTVRSIGERASVVQDLNGKLRFLQNELKRFANGKVSNCSNTDSRWEIVQGGLLLHSHCELYKSAMEEVRIWGWPLQTAGLLTTGFSSRSFTILSGRVTEWSNGKIGFVTRKANASWVQRKWGASAIQLDRNTWIIEYRRSPFLENPRLFSSTMELLKYRLTTVTYFTLHQFIKTLLCFSPLLIHSTSIMAKLSFACNCGGTSGFSESEIDVARQLIRLCSDDDDIDGNVGGLTGKRRRVEDDESGVASAMVMDDDEHFKLRKRKSRSIHYIYRSTKPLVVFDAKKICST